MSGRGARWPAALVAGLAALALAACGDSAAPPAAPAPDAGWPQWGGSPAGQRFSPAAQITPANVRGLREVWRYSTGELARRSPAMLTNSSNQNTPLLAAGHLILCTPFARVVALDPATGRERWVFDPAIDPTLPLPNQYVCRGVAQWRDPAVAPDAPCATRLFVVAVDNRLFAIDAATGRRCAGFGRNGEVRVDPGPLRHAGEVKLAAPPTVVRGVVVVGSSVLDNVRTPAPSGMVRAFDARTGAPRWTFEPLVGDARAGADGVSPPSPGGANVWTAMAADDALGLVYLPTSSAAPDYWGGARPGANAHANSIVAVDATTGRMVWARQLIHHDVWDYDTPAQPTLVDIRRDGRLVPALVQPTKQGFLFVLDRRTGAPLFPIVERPVPQGGAPGEQLWPTQPHPLLPRPIAPQSITPDEAWGFTFWDRARCRDRIARYRSEGLFTPPSTQGTITYPAASGGANWGAGAVDPARGIYFINSSRVASVITLKPRTGPGGGTVALETMRDVSPMDGTPFAVEREWLVSPLGAPCTPPPWGGLTAIDLATGRTLWDVPLGTINFGARRSLPFDLTLGSPNLGGPVVTAGGVLFIAAAMDNRLRAFAMADGRLLWQRRLPGGAQTTPITYATGGRQFVVVSTGAHLWFGTPASDQVVAFALP